MDTSAVLLRCPDPDWYDCQTTALPPGATTDPARWAREVFDVRRTHPFVQVLLGLRQLLVPLLGVPRTRGNPFEVTEVVGDEAILGTSERHLDFWCGVRATKGALQVTTAVRLHGWRGRLYLLPVRVLHGPITRAMMRRAVSRVSAEQ